MSMTREFALNRIAILMGGRCAEELIFDQRTTGAGNDIEQATELARKMVTEWGMSEAIGPLNFGKGGNEVFLGRDFSKGEAYSEDTAQRIDGEIRRICTEQYDRAKSMLTGAKEVLEKVGKALLQFETLSGEEVKTIFDGGVVTRAAKSSADTTEPAEDLDSTIGGDVRAPLFPPIGKADPDPEPA